VGNLPNGFSFIRFLSGNPANGFSFIRFLSGNPTNGFSFIRFLSGNPANGFPFIRLRAGNRPPRGSDLDFPSEIPPQPPCAMAETYLFRKKSWEIWGIKEKIIIFAPKING